MQSLAEEGRPAGRTTTTGRQDESSGCTEREGRKMVQPRKASAGEIQDFDPTDVHVSTAMRGARGGTDMWTFQDMDAIYLNNNFELRPADASMAQRLARSQMAPSDHQLKVKVSAPATVSIDLPQESQLTRNEQSKTFKISMKNLSYKVQKGKQSIIPDALLPSTSSKSCSTPRKVNPAVDPSPNEPSSSYLLKNINCKANPGEILAVAGPSGAGKSTLLDALGGRINPKSLEGEILVNEKPVHVKYFRRITGYVMQDDALFPMLTVRETLLYSARLRLPGAMSLSEKCKRVEDLIQELGLKGAAETRIGNEDVRGVSGGERRRVSIGVDLIHDPPVLLLDEPTSGLDSTAALNIIEVLHDMAVHGRRTIILSIHQPSFRILELFHNLLLLSQGSVVHHGTLDALELRFRMAGEEIPPRVNPLEYAIDALDLQQYRKLTVSERSSRKMWTSHEELSEKLRTVVFADEPPLSSEEGEDAEGATGSHGLPGSDLSSEPIGFACSPMQETWTLATRYYKNIFRTKELFNGRAAQVAVCGVSLGTLFLHVHNDTRGQVERLGFLAFSLAFLLTSSVEALPIFLQERQILMRETTRGAYRTSSYLFASTLVFMPFLLVLALLFSTPAYWLVGFSPNFGAFLFFVLVVWLVLLSANSIVACFAAISPNYITGNSMVAGILGACFLFSGYFIAQEYIPSYWIWAHYLSIFKYPFDALLVNEYRSRASACFLYDSLNGDVCIQTGQQYLESAGLGSTNKWMDVAILLTFICLFRFLGYLALRFLQKNVRQ